MSNLARVKDLFVKALPELKAAAPKHITAERMIKVLTASMTKTPALAEASPSSLLIALMTATELGLEPNTPLGHGYIVPQKVNGRQEAMFVPGYRGLVYLAVLSGQVLDVRSQVVRTKDEWTFKDGRGGVQWSWAPSEEEDRGPVRLVYAAADLAGGREHIEVMTFAQIERIRKAAPSARGRSSPWDNHWEEMARKTAIKRLCKHLPMSTERGDLLMRAVELDNRIESDVDTDSGAAAAELVASVMGEAARQAEADAMSDVADQPADVAAPQLQQSTTTPVDIAPTQAQSVAQQVRANTKKKDAPAPAPANDGPREPTAVEKAAAERRAREGGDGPQE
jgi:recombination protein RecT